MPIAFSSEHRSPSVGDVQIALGQRVDGNADAFVAFPAVGGALP